MGLPLPLFNFIINSTTSVFATEHYALPVMDLTPVLNKEDTIFVAKKLRILLFLLQDTLNERFQNVPFSTQQILMSAFKMTTAVRTTASTSRVDTTAHAQKGVAWIPLPTKLALASVEIK